MSSQKIYTKTLTQFEHRGHLSKWIQKSSRQDISDASGLVQTNLPKPKTFATKPFIRRSSWPPTWPNTRRNWRTSFFAVGRTASEKDDNTNLKFFSKNTWKVTPGASITNVLMKDVIWGSSTGKFWGDTLAPNMQKDNSRSPTLWLMLIITTVKML